MACKIAFALLIVAVGVSARWEMIWNDEFDGPAINHTKWQHEINCWGGGNNEKQCYTSRAANSYITNGTLVIKAIQEWYTGTQADCTDPQGCTNTLPYTSARLRTMMDPSGSWTGGRFEIRAKCPDGAFLWPAIWMLPRTSDYGGWAASGEIDIMEARGQNLYSYGTTLHYGGQWPNNHYWGQDHATPDLSRDFHLWTLEWTPYQQMLFYFDGALVQTYDLNRWWWESSWGSTNPYWKMGQPWDKPFYMILNMAVGGNFFGGAQPASNQGSLWRDPTLAVDYVRVYKYTDAIATTQAVTTKAVTTQAVTTSPVTTQAVTTEAVTTEAATTEAVTTQAVSTGAVSTGAVSTGAVSTGFQTTGAAASTEVVVPATTGETEPSDGSSSTSESAETTGAGSATTTTGESQPADTNETMSSTGVPPIQPADTASANQQDKPSLSRTDSSSKLSAPAQIGIIVVGCVCGAVLIAAAVFIIRKRMQKAEPATVALDDLVSS